MNHAATFLPILIHGVLKLNMSQTTQLRINIICSEYMSNKNITRKSIKIYRNLYCIYTSSAISIRAVQQHSMHIS